MHLGGRAVFPPGTSPQVIRERYMEGSRVMTMIIGNAREAQNAIPNVILPLLVMPDDEKLLIWTEEDPPTLRKGVRVIGLIKSSFYEELLEKGTIVADVSQIPETAIPQA